MADWDRSDVFSMAPSMYPPTFMWMGENNTYDVEREKEVIQKHYGQAVDVLDGGRGYDALKAMKARLEDHHSRAEQSKNSHESRRNYARLQFAVVKQKVVSIAQERVEGEDDEAIEDETNQILDEPIGTHWRTDEGKVDKSLDGVWAVTASGINPDERWADGKIPISDVNIHFRPEKSDFAKEFNEDHLNSTDRRIFDGDETWQDVVDSIHRRWERLKERHERAANTKELLRFRRSIIETVLYRFEAFGNVERNSEGQGTSEKEKTQNQKPGRPKLIEQPEEVMTTLDAVCEWLEDDPPKVFEGENGLVNFVSQKLDYLEPSSVSHRIKTIFKQLSKEHPDLPAPNLTTGTNGEEYVRGKSDILKLRDEYESQFIEE